MCYPSVTGDVRGVIKYIPTYGDLLDIHVTKKWNRKYIGI